MARFGKGYMRYIMVLECVALTLFSFLLCPAEAYSYDERYLDYVNWQGEEVESVTINNPDVDGSIKYFSRGTSIYFLFDLYNENITSQSEISMVFEVSCEGKEYNFTLSNDEDEFYESADKYLDATYQADGYNEGQGIAIALIDVNDKIYTHSFNIRAYIDGRIYKITKSKLNIITTPPPTTTKVTTTRAKTTKQTTTKKSTTAKSKSSTTAKNKSEKSSSTQKVTKFKAPEDFEESTTENTDSEEEPFESEYESAETEEGHMTKKSKILLAAAISFMTLGFAFVLLYYFINQKKSEDDNIDNISENDLN